MKKKGLKILAIVDEICRITKDSRFSASLNLFARIFALFRWRLFY